MKKIQLTKDQVALVDDWNYEELNSRNWFAQWDKCTQSYYACRHVKVNGKQYRISMHSQIAKPPQGMVTDHINRNPLDNREENLRVCTKSQNQCNRAKNRNSTTGYKGVFVDHTKWTARIRFEGKAKRLGTFSSPEDAARAYDLEAKKIHGEFAVLNFPK